MSMRPLVIGCSVVLLYLSALSPLDASARKQEEPQAEAQEAAEPAFSCGDCHDVAETFKMNPHARGRLADGTVPNHVCEGCHGDGTAHMEGGGDPEQIFTPRGLTGADSCLMCHSSTTMHGRNASPRTPAQQRRPARSSAMASQPSPTPPLPQDIFAFATSAIARRGHGAHANTNQVNCLTCHSVHNSEPRAPRLLVSQELAVCTSCHSTQASSFRSHPYAHRIGRGGMECSSCHDPHAPRGRDNLRSASGSDLPCLSCHTEKRGPFVFPHNAGTVGDCTSCHTPHGSPNAKQLTRATVAQLCIECHSPITGDTLGSQPPSFHNLSLPRYQQCTTCHVAVHGSNRSPALLK